MSFSFKRTHDASIPPVSPWHSIELVWLGEATGITGRDLEVLRVVEAPQRSFGLDEIGPSDPRFDSTTKPLVPSLELVFTAAGDERFREVLRSLWNGEEEGSIQGKAIALLLGGQLFQVIHIPPPHLWSPKVERTSRIELTHEKFEEVVSHIEASLGCSQNRN